MKQTYTLDQSIALERGEGYFDLHNDYELVSVLRDGARYYLHLAKRVAAWVKASDPSHLALVFEPVHFFQQSEGIPLPTSVEEMGFKAPDDEDLNWFQVQAEGEADHFLIRLEDDHFIRIGAGASFLLTSS